MSDEPVVEEIMVREVHTVPPGMQVLEAVTRMNQLGSRHLVVAEEGKVVGMLSERDVLKHLSPWLSKVKPKNDYQRPIRGTVKQFMARHVQTIGPKVPLHEAAGILAHGRISSLPVVTDERLVGILTVTDLLLYMHRAGAAADPVKA